MTKFESTVFGTICLVMGWVFLFLKVPWLSLPFLGLALVSLLHASWKESR